MSSKTLAADEYAYINQRIKEIEREKTAALNSEAPKAWPDYTPVDYMYMAPEEDPA